MSSIGVLPHVDLPSSCHGVRSESRRRCTSKPACASYSGDASPALCWHVVHRRHAWERSLGLALIVDSGPSPPPRNFFHAFNDKIEVPNYSRRYAADTEHASGNHVAPPQQHPLGRDPLSLRCAPCLHSGSHVSGGAWQEAVVNNA